MKKLLLAIMLVLVGCAKVPSMGQSEAVLVDTKVWKEMPDSCYEPQDRCFVDPCYPDRLVCVQFWHDKESNTMQFFQPSYSFITNDAMEVAPICEDGYVTFSDPCMGGRIEIGYFYNGENIILSYWGTRILQPKTDLLYVSF